MTEEDRIIHFVTGKRFTTLKEPIFLSQVVCPDCGGNEGWNAIFEPKDGPERV